MAVMEALIVIVLVALLVALAGGGFWLSRQVKHEAALRDELQAERDRRTAAENERAAQEKRVAAVEAERAAQKEAQERRETSLQDDLQAKNRALDEAREKRVALEAEVSELRTRLEESKKSFEEARKLFDEERQKAQDDREQMMQKATAQFENLAQKALETNLGKFDTEGRERMKETLAPLERDLKSFRERVDRIHTESEGRNSALQEQIKLLKDNAMRISDDANNLAQALRGKSQALGAFGELTLERLLEDSGLRRGVEYEAQPVMRDDEGRPLRPDFRVNLPEERHLIIDSKASLSAWHDYVNAEDDAARVAKIAAHVAAVRKHVGDLSAKHYASLQDAKQPDFVLMFMPIESAWMAALTEDQALFSEAYEKKVILVSRTTLMPTLRVVAQIWKYERQTKNARKIADRAGHIYDKVRVLIGHFDAVGKALETADKKYHDARGSLISGSGNVVRQLEQLDKLGANIKTRLPQSVRAEARGDDGEVLGEDDSEAAGKGGSGGIDDARAAGDGDD